MAGEACAEDDFFGPTVQHCRGGFDFTIKFELVVMSLIPASLFLTAALLRILILVRRPLVVQSKSFHYVKLGATTAYCALQLGLLTLTTRLNGVSNIRVSSSVLSLLSGLGIAVLSSLEHFRSRRTSILLGSYLLFIILLNIVRARTLWLASTQELEYVICQVFTASTATESLLLILESVKKRPPKGDENPERAPQETTGLFELATYSWLSPLFVTGYKKVLNLDDLFPLDRALDAEGLQESLDHHFHSSSSKHQRHGMGLAKALAKTLAKPLIFPIGLRAALIAFRFCQPFLIRTLLDHMNRSEPSRNAGYGLIGAAVLIYLGMAFSTALYWYLHERALAMSRSALGGVIYQKTITAKVPGDPAALTLMSTDVERIRLGFLNLHEFWANTVEVALASWLLHGQIGTAFVAPLVLVLCCIICGGYVNRYTAPRQKAWVSLIEKRVGWTAGIISGMKHLKISGLTEPVGELIQRMRTDELDAASYFRTVYVLVIGFGYAPLALCPVVTFAVTARDMDTATIFTSLSYILLLADPLGYIFQNSPHLLAAFACLDRIQVFLNQDSRVDLRTSGVFNTKSQGQQDSPEPGNSEAGPKPLVKITSGRFGWKAGEWALLDIDLYVPRHGLTMVIGPIASGKSTLCKAILGEVPFSQGEVMVSPALKSGRVGYCEQTPFLLNTTIRNNILGFAPLNYTRYREVIEAAALKPDLAFLPNGDESSIGSNGLALSGGQKKRLSLARALYLDCAFFLFDDILSGLDADTEDQVFHRVFGPGGLLRRRGATAVMCTNSTQYLPFADHIIALGEGGVVREQGTFEDLSRDGGYIHSLGLNKYSHPNGREGPVPLAESKDSDLTEAASPIPHEPKNKVEDDRSRMLQDYTVYRHYLLSLGKRSIAAFTIFGFGWGFFYNWGTVWLKFWSEDLASPQQSHSNSFYVGLYGLFQATCLASIFLSFFICFRTMIHTSGASLHKEALHTVLHAPLSFFTNTDVGVITTLFSQDMGLIDNELPIALTNLVMDVFNALGLAAVIVSSSYWLVFAYPLIFAALYFIQKFYLRTSRQLRLLDLEAKSPLYTHFLDTIGGITTFRALGWVQDGIRTNTHLLNQSQKPNYLLAMVQRWLLFVLTIIVALLAVAVVSVATQLNSDAGLTGASLVSLMTFGEILNYVIRWWTQMETSIGAVGRLKKLSEEVKSEGGEGEDIFPPNDWPSRGEISIRNVSASYSNDSSEPHGLALRNLSVSIRPSEKVAICGRSGSGKSSTILLLLKLLDPLPDCSDNITIDDLPLHKIDRQALRKRIIAVPQEPVFLPDGTSILSNIDPLHVSTETECMSALETVGLWAAIEQRGGLGEGLWAGTLSQGQKQLFDLARAILRRRVRSRELREARQEGLCETNSGGVLLLDEVSSSMDHETDRAIQRIVEEEFQGYTVIMVSHRLEMVMKFDTVLVMDSGAIVETGCPATLSKTDGSRFKALWSISNKK